MAHFVRLTEHEPLKITFSPAGSNLAALKVPSLNSFQSLEGTFEARELNKS